MSTRARFKGSLMCEILVGILAILVGSKAFTPSGLPLTRSKNLTGTTAMVIGFICIVFGSVLVVGGTVGFIISYRWLLRYLESGAV